MDSLLALTGPFGPDGPLALTGPAICWIATALALAGLVVAVVGMPRHLRAPCTGAVRAALTQAVALLLCLVLVLAAIGAWMNREFVFYGTWGDLLGTSPDAVSAETFGGASDADGAPDAGGASDKTALRKALEKADFPSVRGPFKFGPNHYPVQDFYLCRVIRRADGRYQTSIVKKILDNDADAYAAACRMS